jgi:two-component system, cell cycle response regulator
MADKILLVEDSTFETAYITRLLHNYTILHASSGEEIWPILKDEAPSIILLDVILPGEDGFQIAKQLAGNEKYADIPIIFITQKDQGRDVEEGFESGAVDYIKKPYNELELRARIRSAVMKKRRELDLREKTITDPLTGVFNRRHFFDCLESSINHSLRRKQNIFSISLVDVDHLKSINDTHGHQAGDHVLREVADVLKKKIRSYDIMARFGGDEFIILFNDCAKRETGEIMHRIKEYVAKTPVAFNNNTISVTLSCGVSDFSEVRSDEIGAEHLIGMADKRLYSAKNAGRNTIVTV